jgi:hypothetical protein
MRKLNLEETTTQTKLGFGKYKDLPLSDVPRDYLEWLIENSRDKIAFYERELQRRDNIEDANLTMAERLLKSGYRDLMKKHHPDAGGSHESCLEVQAAYDLLQEKFKLLLNPFANSPTP